MPGISLSLQHIGFGRLRRHDLKSFLPFPHCNAPALCEWFVSCKRIGDENYAVLHARVVQGVQLSPAIFDSHERNGVSATQRADDRRLKRRRKSHLQRNV
jgi:hypothetical protein